jgi:NCS1 family nucleobase:cation symporter-1
MIVDYFVVRRKELALTDLYLADGAYRYKRGWNLSATMATVAGCAIAWAGLFVPALHIIYDFAWFVGFVVSAGLYLVLRRVLPA